MKTTVPFTQDKNTLTADGIDAITLSGLPAGTTVTFDRKPVAVGEGVAKLTTSKPGAHTAFLSCPPNYWSAAIGVTAAEKEKAPLNEERG